MRTFLTTLALLPVLAGCGTPGPPRPPSLHLPAPVADLSALRSGDTVLLRWTMPRRTTDDLALTAPVRAILCSVPSPGVCLRQGTTVIAPGTAAAYTLNLPPELTQGSLRPIPFAVELLARSGRTAGLSNIAAAIAGPALPPVTGLNAQATPAGILLRWQAVPVPPGTTVRIDRELADPRDPKPSRSKTSPAAEAIPALQQLRAPDSENPLAATIHEARDRTAPLDHRYRYRAFRVLTTLTAGQALTLESAPTPPFTLDARDLFPPSVPAGLAAVADVAGHAIDLSWEPSPEPDTAAYIVYRAAPGQPFAQLAAHITGPAWRDTTAVPGVRYRYVVTAIDRDGNQGAQSAPAEEALPAG